MPPAWGAAACPGGGCVPRSCVGAALTFGLGIEAYSAAPCRKGRQGKARGEQLLPGTIPRQPRISCCPEKPCLYLLALIRQRWHRALQRLPSARGSGDCRCPGRMAWLLTPLLLSCHHPVAAGSLVLLGSICTAHNSPALISRGHRVSLWEVYAHHGQENQTLERAAHR